MILSGQVAVVTGAGRGVGRGIALAVAAAGARTVVTGRSDEGVASTVTEVRDRGGDARGFRCVVGDRASVDAMMASVHDTCGRIDAFVHNAAGDLPEARWPVEDVTDEQWASQATTSIRGTFDCAQAAFPHLERTGGSFIVLTSSAGASGTATLPVYAAVKGAQRGFIRSLAREWGPHGVRVNGIGPLALTRGLQRSFEANPAAEHVLTERIPLRRVGDATDDIGAVAVFLASWSSRYVTGQTLFADGGVFMGS